MAQGRDFIRTIIDRDLREERYDRIVTRFPPEPNGYLHIGHAKSVCLNFGLAREYGGRCTLRFDDTNPLTEEEVYTSAIRNDVRWLGFEWDELRHASDYFERMYEVAERLIERGKAYVDSSSEAEIREARGTVTEPGRPTGYRDRSVTENLELFRRMRAGEFEEGAHVLRAKADLASPNMIMRDPVLYRIRHARHYRTGDAWCIYPLYDFAHCLEDAFEGVTHSLCTLEFDNNREIYDWILDEAGFEEPRTHQYEFARLNLDYTVLSKRKLLRLVKEGHVEGWDDPRMPTLAGLRRRGVPPEAIRSFCEMIGVAKADSRVDMGKFEFAIRDTLNRSAPRTMGVLRPLPLTVTNWGEGPSGGAPHPLEVERFPGVERPEGEAVGRTVHFGGALWVDRDDVADPPPEGWRRLTPGREVRLRGAWVFRCEGVERDPEGRIEGVRGTIDPDTLGRNPEGRTVEGTIHWISEVDAVDAELRLIDRLFRVADPEATVAELPDPAPGGAPDPAGDVTDLLNPDSLEVVTGAKIPRELAELSPGAPVQFERIGYFAADPESTPDRPVLNRIVTLRDSWKGRASREGRGKAPGRGGQRRERVVIHQSAEERISEERRAARAADPELAARFDRYRERYGLGIEEADLLTGRRAVADLFEAALAEHAAPRAVAPWIVNDLRALLPDGTGEAGVESLRISGGALGRLVAMVGEGTISRRAGKEVLELMAGSGEAPEVIVEREGLTRLADPEALGARIEEVLTEWPEKVAEYREGNRNLLGLFMGQVMKKTGGRADPALTRELLTTRLDGR